jgi:predicted metal-dependent hydrolase
MDDDAQNAFWEACRILATLPRDSYAKTQGRQSLLLRLTREP